jgi:release factor glutamine methyltransferase
VPREIAENFERLRLRRAAGEPLAYLTGWREFMGHRLGTSPAVLVPRPETEHLVEAALMETRTQHRAGSAASHRLNILDLGTGSGAVAISLALARPHWQVFATDRSAAALTQARANAHALGAARIVWWQGDWWQALPPGCEPFDLIVSNPPYLAADDPHLDDPALRHEPQEALVSGPSGLESIEAIVSGAQARLKPAGWLMIEHGYAQGACVRDLLQAAGFTLIHTRPDLAGLDRITIGQRAVMAGPTESTTAGQTEGPADCPSFDPAV